jgi:hypothetical protein
MSFYRNMGLPWHYCLRAFCKEDPGWNTRLSAAALNLARQLAHGAIDLVRVDWTARALG